jgi:hypothetical protein
MGEFIEDVWYDKELLEEDMDQNSTMGKSYEAAVGWINNKWRDQYVDPEDFKDEDMDEAWEEYERELEERDGMDNRSPFFSKVLTQAEEKVFLSRFSPITTSRVFGSGFLVYSFKALAPLMPGP